MMPTQPSHFIWYELCTSNPGKAAAFYGAVLGWTVQDSGQEGMDYKMWLAGGEAVGGMLQITPDMALGGMEDGWLGYVDVADVDACVEDIVAGGGHSHMVQDVPGVGKMAMVTDPQGAAFYVMKPTPPPGGGASTAFAPDRPGHGGWNELHTKDSAAAAEFYGARFGWAESTSFDMGPMGLYRLFNAGDGDIGGMMDSPNFPRPMWVYYFNVEDIDAAKTRIEAAGGTVLNGPHEVPTGRWIIQARDPQGAMFAVLAPGRA